MFLLLTAGCLVCSSLPAGPGQASSAPAVTLQVHQSIEQRFAGALAAYRAQHFDQAVGMLLPLVKSNPNNFQINELLGLVFVAEGQDEKANPILEKAFRLQPQNSEARTVLATNLVRLHRTQEAEVQFRKVVELDSKNYDANHNLGEFYIQVGRLNDAIPFLKRAQEIHPDAENNGYDLALAYETDGKLKEARRELEELLARNDSAELHSLLGEVEEKSKDYLASAAQYQLAARMDPSEQNIFDWGTELLLHQTFAPAAQVFKAGLDRYPRSRRLQIGLGIALYGDGRYDDAASTFFGASDMKPADPLPLTFLGKGYDSFSAPVAEQVRSRLESFLKTDSKSAAVRYYYALILWKLNEKEPNPELAKQTEQLLKAAISIDPSYTDAFLQLGIVYANQANYRQAISYYQTALKLSPNLPNIHYRLGQVLMRARDSARAKAEFDTFESLRQAQSRENDKEDSAVKQFIYTMRDSSTATENPSAKSRRTVPRGQ